MSEESKKIEKIEQEAKESEVSDQDLENAAGGAQNSAGCPAPTVGKTIKTADGHTAIQPCLVLSTM
jgi:hypothetical protein